MGVSGTDTPASVVTGYRRRTGATGSRRSPATGNVIKSTWTRWARPDGRRLWYGSARWNTLSRSTEYGAFWTLLRLGREEGCQAKDCGRPAEGGWSHGARAASHHCARRRARSGPGRGPRPRRMAGTRPRSRRGSGRRHVREPAGRREGGALKVEEEVAVRTAPGSAASFLSGSTGVVSSWNAVAARAPRLVLHRRVLAVASQRSLGGPVGPRTDRQAQRAQRSHRRHLPFSHSAPLASGDAGERWTSVPCRPPQACFHSQTPQCSTGSTQRTPTPPKPGCRERTALDGQLAGETAARRVQSQPDGELEPSGPSVAPPADWMAKTTGSGLR